MSLRGYDVIVLRCMARPTSRLSLQSAGTVIAASADIACGRGGSGGGFPRSEGDVRCTEEQGAESEHMHFTSSYTSLGVVVDTCSWKQRGPSSEHTNAKPDTGMWLIW